jgi:hypothetical protein
MTLVVNVSCTSLGDATEHTKQALPYQQSTFQCSTVQRRLLLLQTCDDDANASIAAASCSTLPCLTCTAHI